MKYRKKPVIIDAWLTRNVALAAKLCWEALPAPIKEAYEKGGWVFESNYKIHIPTLEGTMTANPDDYIIQGVNGEFYPCKPDIFEKTYELVENE